MTGDGDTRAPPLQPLGCHIANIVPIAREIEQTVGRSVTLAAVYLALDRLCTLITWQLGDPTPERGGGVKRLFSVTPRGLHAVRQTQRPFMGLCKGVPELKGMTA